VSLPPPPGPLAEIAEHLRPALSTKPDGELPDIGPGMGQARDDGLDAIARATTNAQPLAPAGESEGERRAGADLDASLQQARARVADDAEPVLPAVHDPLDDIRNAD
jgi:hypothetical protein